MILYVRGLEAVYLKDYNAIRGLRIRKLPLGMEGK
jgi:hypothetical protein